MKFNKILLFAAAFAACLLIGSSFGQDYLTYGDVSSSRTDDPGLAGMLRWLDQPVPAFPWYTTGGSFYRQPYSETTFSPYKEYYAPAKTTSNSGIISNPAKFDITGRAPSVVYYGGGSGLPYSQYASLYSKTNDLWIQGRNNWTQYAVVPVGTWLQLVAHVPVGGAAGFYETVQTDTASSKYMTYQFSSGYTSMSYYADSVGRHMLYFVVNSQPSNVVIVDVFAQAKESPKVSTYQPPAQSSVNVLGSGTSAGSFATYPRSYPSFYSYPYSYYPYSYYPYSYTPYRNPDGYTTATTSDGKIITTTDGKTTVTPLGKTTTVSGGPYTTTISPDGTQTTTSFPQGATVTTDDGVTTTVGPGWTQAAI